MRFPVYLLILGIFAVISMAPSSAYAKAKPWVFGWWPTHWENMDFQPYLENGKHPHNSQWNDSEWTPEDWLAQRKDGMDAVQGFYNANVIHDQYMDDDVPVLEVGPSFYRLSGHDKRRVTKLVDEVYQITKNDIYGMYMVVDGDSGKPIGVYTNYGLQLQ